MENTLYWLYNPTTKLTKIGITENLDQRLKQIENACGCEVKLVAYATFEHASIVERLILNVYKKYITKGEWLQLKNIIDTSFLSIMFDNIFQSFRNNNGERAWFFNYKASYDKKFCFDIYYELEKEIGRENTIEVTNEL